MADITIEEAFDEYRDSLRLVWNLALRFRKTGDKYYSDLSDVLFDSLVFSAMAHATDDNTERTKAGYVPALGVLVRGDACCVARREVLEDITKWAATDIGLKPEETVLLNYMDVMDYNSSDERGDLEYVVAYVPANAGSLSEGDVVAIPRSQVEIKDLTRTGLL